MKMVSYFIKLQWSKILFYYLILDKDEYDWNKFMGIRTVLYNTLQFFMKPIFFTSGNLDIFFRHIQGIYEFGEIILMLSKNH